MLAGLPWHLVRGILALLPGVVLGVLLGAATTWVGLQAPLTLEGGVQRPAALWAGALLALVVAWLMPTSRSARDGARAMIDVLTPTRGFRALLVVLVLGVAAVVAVQVALGGAPAPPGRRCRCRPCPDRSAARRAPLPAARATTGAACGAASRNRTSRARRDRYPGAVIARHPRWRTGLGLLAVVLAPVVLLVASGAAVIEACVPASGAWSQVALRLALLHPAGAVRERDLTRAVDAELEVVATAWPHVANRVDGALTPARRVLAAGHTTAPVLSHGDFTPAQLVPLTDGIGLLDLDTLHLGEGAADVGRYLAYHDLAQARRRTREVAPAVPFPPQTPGPSPPRTPARDAGATRQQGEHDLATDAVAAAGDDEDLLRDPHDCSSVDEGDDHVRFSR
ncbi:hypothetical protein [Georgenia sp. SUBG003]|uniref:hypothetical protein n=1 Tax=Georgenia sp. SUBG003 TaxID=1497974 RepID=UPI003AB5C95E